MVTKKRVATKASVLKFNPDWIKDPVPPFFKDLSPAARRELTQAKREFTARIKDILARGQQR